MPRLTVIVVAAVAVAALLNAVSKPTPLAARVGTAPVVVELFTSQGCSSCPPADELLGRMQNDPALRGRVIALAFHVDYWNHLGWRDPFSSAEWSERQHAYVRAFDLGGAYTPQAVVGGAREMVGSDERKVFAAIEEESKRPPSATVSITADGMVHVDAPRELELIVLSVDSEQTTKVPSGENEGRTLANYAIVRKMVRVGMVRGKIEKRIELGGRLVALLQDPKTMRIWSAAAMPPLSSTR
jgi:hypothetical protein